MISRTTRFAPDDLLRMPDGDRFELVGGELVEKAMGVEACVIAGTINTLINQSAWPAKLGTAIVEPSVVAFPDDPNKLRKPDVAFIRRKRFADGTLPTGNLQMMPDLIVEVVSPNDVHYDVVAKVDEYLDAGAEIVWTVTPPTKSVRVDRRNGASTIYRGDDVISGESVIPGFSCPVSAFFVNPLQSP